MAPIKFTRSHVCNCITAVQKLFHVLVTHEMFLQPKHLLYKEEQRGHCSQHLRKSTLLPTQSERTYNAPVNGYSFLVLRQYLWDNLFKTRKEGKSLEIYDNLFREMQALRTECMENKNVQCLAY
jgi:hypothetical protein